MRWALLTSAVTLGCNTAGASSLGPAPAASGSAPVTPVAAAPLASAPAPSAAPSPGPACPAGEVLIPATPSDGFVMGKGAPGTKDQKHRVVLTRSFCMDATEVSVGEYRRCVDAGRCTVPQLNDANSNYRPEFHRDDHPLNMVNWTQATEFCAQAGKVLPTEAQWEWAAGHGDGRLYPWGDTEPTCQNDLADFTPGGTPHADPAGNLGCGGGGTSPIKAFPLGKTVWPAGELYELGGNVWEWTRDCYLPYPSGTVTDPSPQEHPSLHGQCYVRSLRGGGWNRSVFGLRVTYRAASKKTYRVPALGFRCVREG